MEDVGQGGEVGGGGFEEGVVDLVGGGFAQADGAEYDDGLRRTAERGGESYEGGRGVRRQAGVLGGEGVEADGCRLEVHADEVCAGIVVEAPAVGQLRRAEAQRERVLVDLADLERHRVTQTVAETHVDQPDAVRILDQTGDGEDHVTAIDAARAVGCLYAAAVHLHAVPELCQ